MDEKSQELYAEENRTLLIDIEKSITALLKKYAVVTEVKATIENDELEVRLNNKTLSVKLENEIDLQPAFVQLSKDIVSAVKAIKVDEVKVNNLKDIKQRETVKISNLSKLEKTLQKLLEKDFNFVVKQEAPKFPILAKDAIPVRLSDGKAFYKAQAGVIAQALTGNSTETKQDDAIALLTQIEANTDELEIKAENINLNTDGIEAKLDTLESDKATATKQENMLTQLNPLSTIKTSAVSLTTVNTAYKLPATEQVGRRTVVVYNVSDTDVYLGDSSVTTTNGILLASGEQQSLDIAGGLYAVCGTASKTINILEMK